MPLTKTFNYRLTYTLTSAGGNGVDNTLPFTSRSQMVNYAKRLHKSNPLSWNVKLFEQKSGDAWSKDETAHMEYRAGSKAIKSTHVHLSPLFTRLSVMARDLEKVAVRRELTEQEKADFLSLVGELSTSLLPADILSQFVVPAHQFEVHNPMPDFEAHTAHTDRLIAQHMEDAEKRKDLEESDTQEQSDEQPQAGQIRTSKRSLWKAKLG